jgi:hypothetical protein
VKILNDAINWHKNENLTLRIFIRFCPHKNNSNIGLSDKDQEFLDKLKLQDFIEKEKSKSPTPPSNPSGSFTNYKKLALEIHLIDKDRSQYYDFSKRTQPGHSTTCNKLNMHSHTKNFNKI